MYLKLIGDLCLIQHQPSQKYKNQSFPSQAQPIVSFRLSLGSLIMRADIQIKPLGFQEVTASDYRCVAFCVVK